MIEKCFSAIEKLPRAPARKIFFFIRNETPKAYYIKELVITDETCIFASQRNTVCFYYPNWIAKRCLTDIKELKLEYEEIPKKHYFESQDYKFIALS